MGPELLAKARKETTDDNTRDTAASAQPELNTAA
jgi:hypothetical protein